METLIYLLEKKKHKVIYRFGTDAIDGIMEIDLEDTNNSKIVKMPSDGKLSSRVAYNAFGWLFHLVVYGFITEKIEYLDCSCIEAKIISMPSDGVVEKGYANNAFGHMLNLSRRGEFPAEKTYATG